MNPQPQKRGWGFWDFVLLIPSIPIFFILLYFAERRDPWQVVRRVAAFIVKSFFLFMAVWIVFGALTVILDHRHHNVYRHPDNPGYVRCFPTTQICTDPEGTAYGPLVWIFLHGPMVPLGMAAVDGRELGKTIIERRITVAYWFSTMAVVGSGSIFSWWFLRLGVYLYLSLLFFPVIAALWLFFTVKGYLL